MKRVKHLSPRPGLLHWVHPLMIGLVAVTVLLSGRDLAKNFSDLTQGGGLTMHPAVPWLQRVVSLGLVLISLERIYAWVSQPQRRPLPLLAWVFAGYWAATVALPSLFGAHRNISHEYLYPLVIGIAAFAAPQEDRERSIRAARTALFVFLLAGVVVAVVQPSLALDMKYSQGLLPGIPRMGGLATHPVALGSFAQIFLLLLWVHPFQRRWLNVIAWMVGLGVLFFAQSKTAWIGFTLCAAALLAVRSAPQAWQRMGDPRHPEYGIGMLLMAIVLIAAFLGVVLFADIGSEAADFLQTPEGAQLMTMTGRDQIWAVAWEEWRANPVFGYGPTIWDDDFRAAIGMPNATNAHSQFMDTLARSGTIGAIALVIYAGVLLVLAIRHARDTRGLSIALFIALALRSVSEVPVMLFGYGSEFFAHLLLLMTLVPAALPRAVKNDSKVQDAVPRRYRTAT